MIEVIEDSPYLAVSINDMKQLLNIENDDFNESLTNYIRLATRFIERMLGRSFLLKTYRYLWKRKAETCMYNVVSMPMRPVKGVIQITDQITKARVRRYTIEEEKYICIGELYEQVEFVYKAGLADNPHRLDVEIKNLICLVAQAFFEDKDIDTHPCMKVLKCYKENLCM